MPRQRSAPDLFDDEPGFGRGAIGALGRVLSAHPSLAGGSVAFAVIFGFVAANALWHQPGTHPAPILKTRDVTQAPVPLGAAKPEAAGNTAIAGVPARSVTTYRIQRNDETPTASIPVPDIAPAAAAARPAPASDPALARVQQVLADKGLYAGAIDGLMGPKSSAAIRAWEKAAGLAETGALSAGLLASIEDLGKPDRKPVEIARVEPASRPVPAPRPLPAVVEQAGEPAPAAAPAQSPAAAGPSELVRQIQLGLSNIAYADIAVDGVAGQQTRTAIGAFEKHYRLPVTGEPNETVLKKLIEIGAL